VILVFAGGQSTRLGDQFGDVDGFELEDGGSFPEPMSRRLRISF
jgi:hypothetical protein